MTSIFPLRREPDEPEREPNLVDLSEAEADEVFDALGSETARTLLLALHDEPRPASELAEATDTTVQNVQYHLTKLEAADLVEPVGTWYSESGSEMTVYGPADESLVLFAGEDPKTSLRRLLERLIGALGVLALGALAVALAVGGRSQREPTAQDVSLNASAQVTSTGPDPVLTAVAFFCGGIVALAGLFLVARIGES